MNQRNGDLNHENISLGKYFLFARFNIYSGSLIGMACSRASDVHGKNDEQLNSRNINLSPVAFEKYLIRGRYGIKRVFHLVAGALTTSTLVASLLLDAQLRR
ncbi:MAG: hypothetical protein WBA62_22135 [Xanthobacteraceae bacterium]